MKKLYVEFRGDCLSVVPTRDKRGSSEWRWQVFVNGVELPLVAGHDFITEGGALTLTVDLAEEDIDLLLGRKGRA